MSTVSVILEPHYFIPIAESRKYEYSAPLISENAPEFRMVNVSELTTSYTFNSSHYPRRTSDIFIWNPDTKFYIPNRHVTQVAGNTAIHGYSSYNYNKLTRTLYVNSPIVPESGSLRIEWIDTSKFTQNIRWNNWTPIDLYLYQENDLWLPDRYRAGRHISIDFINNKYVYSEGSFKFQGHGNNSYTPDIIAKNGSRCFIEICSKPVFGHVALNDTMDGIMYRGSRLNPVGYDTFQFKLYNQWHQESDSYCCRIKLR